MKIRTLIISTALVSSILGGIAVYIALTVPNDVRAAALLRDAREQLSQGNEEAAREKLTSVVQQYPRTDAAAAATVALLAVADSQRQKLQKQVALVEKQSKDQAAAIKKLAGSVKELSLRPAPVTIGPPAPPAAKPVVKKPPTKKPTRKAPAKKPTTRRRR